MARDRGASTAGLEPSADPPLLEELNLSVERAVEGLARSRLHHFVPVLVERRAHSQLKVICADATIVIE